MTRRDIGMSTRPARSSTTAPGGPKDPDKNDDSVAGNSNGGHLSPPNNSDGNYYHNSFRVPLEDDDPDATYDLPADFLNKKPKTWNQWLLIRHLAEPSRELRNAWCARRDSPGVEVTAATLSYNEQWETWQAEIYSLPFSVKMIQENIVLPRVLRICLDRIEWSYDDGFVRAGDLRGLMKKVAREFIED